jgi:hypothetical protein
MCVSSVVYMMYACCFKMKSLYEVMGYCFVYVLRAGIGMWNSGAKG